MRGSIHDRFWAKVQKTPDCWLWTGARSGRRYGGFRVGSSTLRAHRVSLELDGQTVPADAVVEHLCGQTLCVRPSHLLVSTQAANVQRWWDGKPRADTCRYGHSRADALPNGTCRTCHRDRMRQRRATPHGAP